MTALQTPPPDRARSRCPGETCKRIPFGVWRRLSLDGEKGRHNVAALRTSCRLERGHHGKALLRWKSGPEMSDVTTYWEGAREAIGSIPIGESTDDGGREQCGSQPGGRRHAPRESARAGDFHSTGAVEWQHEPDARARMGNLTVQELKAQRDCWWDGGLDASRLSVGNSIALSVSSGMTRNRLPAAAARLRPVRICVSEQARERTRSLARWRSL